MNLADILTVFRRKNVKHQSIATAEHKFERLVFKPANQNITDFLEELQKLAKDAFGVATVVKQTLTPTTTKPPVMAMPTVQTTEMKENQELSTHPLRPVAKRTTPQRNAFLEPMQQTDRLLGIEDRWNKIKINNKTHRSIQLKVCRLRPKF